MSIIDDINANTQAIINGKSLVTNAIIEKGGTVDQVGDLPTFSELAEGIESIETGGGTGGFGSSLSCLPITNLKVVQIAENTAKITWENPTDPNRAGIQVRTAVGYIPTMPSSLSDVIQDYPADTNELYLYLDNVAIGGIVGVWVMPTNLSGELQALRNVSNTGFVQKLATIDSVLELDLTDAFGTGYVSPMINDNGDVVLASATSSYKKLPYFVDKETGTLVVSETGTASHIYGFSSGVLANTITRRFKVIVPSTQDIFFVTTDTTTADATSGYDYVFRYDATEKILKLYSSRYQGFYGRTNLYLGADGCVYICGTKSSNSSHISCFDPSTGKSASIVNFTEPSGVTSMFNYGGKTYVMNANKALGTIEKGVYTPLNVGTLSNEAVANDELLYAYEDGTLILGTHDNHDGNEPITNFMINYGLTVVNINTSEVTYLRAPDITNYADSFNRAIPLPSGNLLLLGAMGRANNSTSQVNYYKSGVAVYNKSLNEITNFSTKACDINYVYTQDRSKIIIGCGSQKSYYDDGANSSSNMSNAGRNAVSYNVFDVATETLTNKTVYTDSYVSTYQANMLKVMPYKMSNGRIVVLISIKFSDTVKTPVGDFARIYDEATDTFVDLSQKCYYYLAQTSAGDYSSNDLGHLVKYNTVLNDFEEVSEVNTVDVGALVDFKETNSYIYLIGRKYIVKYDKSTGKHSAVLTNYGGIKISALAGDKYYYATTKQVYNPVTGNTFTVTGEKYSVAEYTNKGKTVGALRDTTNKKVLIT